MYTSYKDWNTYIFHSKTTPSATLSLLSIHDPATCYPPALPPTNAVSHTSPPHLQSTCLTHWHEWDHPPATVSHPVPSYPFFSTIHRSPTTHRPTYTGRTGRSASLSQPNILHRLYFFQLFTWYCCCLWFTIHTATVALSLKAVFYKMHDDGVSSFCVQP